MAKYKEGAKVLAVRGQPRTMQPNRCNIGKTGVVQELVGSIDGMPYYRCNFGGREDYVDECNLVRA